MMFNVSHLGLYFGISHVEQAKRQAQRLPYKAAWNTLHESTAANDLAIIQLNGLRYRFENDRRAGEGAVSLIENPVGLNQDAVYWDSLAETIVTAQCYEMLRDHPAFSALKQTQWRDWFLERVTHFNQKPFEMTQAESLWLGLLNVAAGIVLEDETVFEAGAAVYRQTIDESVRPEGYIAKAVETHDGQSLMNQVLSAQALVLMAEAAQHAGVDLWSYSQRGVSVLTATTYPLYYYFYPEKWPWETGLDLEYAAGLFRQHGGFLEILNRRYDRPLRAIRLILKDIRPVNDLYGGGLTTLTHGVAERRGLFG